VGHDVGRLDSQCKPPLTVDIPRATSDDADADNHAKDNDPNRLGNLREGRDQLEERGHDDTEQEAEAEDGTQRLVPRTDPILAQSALHQLAIF
jgi:hypothetical protein